MSIRNRDSETKMTVSIVIPAYNEAKTVKKVVEVINSLNCVDEIIVVDDGSIDGTADIAQKAGATVISHSKNKGKGAAIKTGFESSNGDIVAFIDADLKNLTASQVENIIKPILDGKADITKTKFKRKNCTNRKQTHKHIKLRNASKKSFIKSFIKKLLISLLLTFLY